MERTPPKWLLALIALVATLFAAPGILRHSATWAMAAVDAAIPLLAALALAWFLYHLCLRPRFKLRRLQRIRVKQGRRHPLA